MLRPASGGSARESRRSMALLVTRPQGEADQEADPRRHGEAGERRASHDSRDVGQPKALHRFASPRQSAGEITSRILDLLPDRRDQLLETIQAPSIDGDPARVGLHQWPTPRRKRIRIRPKGTPSSQSNMRSMLRSFTWSRPRARYESDSR